MWRKLARGYPVLAGYNQTGQGQDRTVGRGGDKDMERLRAGGGMQGLGGRGGPGGLAFLLSQRGGGLGWLAFAALWGLCLSLPACNMEKTLALLLLLMHVTWARTGETDRTRTDEVKKGNLCFQRGPEFG